jgi:flagellar assembly protein FliH
MSTGMIADFKETPYVDQSWEVINEVEENPQFNPLDLKVIKTGDVQVADPMFEDYGGRLPESQKKIFSHCPEQGSDISSATKEEELEAEIERLKLEHLELIEQARLEGIQAGIIQGKEEGLKEAIAREEHASDAIRLILEDMIDQMNEAARKVECEAIKFSVEIAEKLVGHAVEINPEYILPIIREALSKAGTANIIRVRVSPEDFEFIEVVGVRQVIQEKEGNWDFEADDTIRSGCVIDTSAGEIDFRLDEAFKRIADNVVRIAK